MNTLSLQLSELENQLTVEKVEGNKLKALNKNLTDNQGALYTELNMFREENNKLRGDLNLT